MIDLIYVLGTVGFFAFMLVYVRACERLGQVAATEAGQLEEPQS
jgi:hypothetical protein